VPETAEMEPKIKKISLCDVRNGVFETKLKF
jgi:hypothetical protein